MNLYVHFPFCRAKCAYCALHSRAGASSASRAEYVARIAREVAERHLPPLKTVYFGGGSPALCDLSPLKLPLADDHEFTVELHPLDVTPAKLDELRRLGVNRISMGVQSFDDAALAAMGRGHTASEAEAAFRHVRAVFPNSGIDLIAGWPGTTDVSWQTTLTRALALAPVHVSCYSLIREPRTRLDLEVRKGRVVLPDDDAALAQVDQAVAALSAAGFRRYEVSNHAVPGNECRHNRAVWRGEDYIGLGEGAHGREGLVRTVGAAAGYARTELPEEADALERAILGLRTAEGIDLAAVVRRWPLLAPRIPEWRESLSSLVAPGILVNSSPDVFVPTSRGFEVADAVMSELV